MNEHSRMKDRIRRRDWVRFEVNHVDVTHQGETGEEFLARGGGIKRLPPAEPEAPKKRTANMPARG